MKQKGWNQRGEMMRLMMGELEEEEKKTKEVGSFNSLLLILTPQARTTH
jgi:hypothetical protein